MVAIYVYDPEELGFASVEGPEGGEVTVAVANGPQASVRLSRSGALALASALQERAMSRGTNPASVLRPDPKKCSAPPTA